MPLPSLQVLWGASDLEREIDEAFDRWLETPWRHGQGLTGWPAVDLYDVDGAFLLLADDKDKLTAEFSRIADLAREAGYWARQEDASALITRKQIRQAIDEKVYRSDWVAGKIRELIREGALRIRIDEGTYGRCVDCGTGVSPSGLDVLPFTLRGRNKADGKLLLGRAHACAASVGQVFGGGEFAGRRAEETSLHPSK